MARYIDADKFIERLKASPAFPNMGMDGYFLLDVVENLLKNSPTADVAPKTEVAMEIFAEMLEKLNHIVITADVDVEYNTFMKTINQVCSAVSAELAELKKKYTEGNNGQK